MHRTYLYAITDKSMDDKEFLGLPGLDGMSPVYFVAHGGLGCAVSPDPGDDLRTVSRERLLRYLLRHQQVVEHVTRGRAVLPVKFGTTVDGPSEVPVLLAQAREELTRALESTRGKVEVEVAATWDTRRVLGAVRSDGAVTRAREAIAVNGSPTLEEQVRLGQVVKACLDRRRDAYRGRMLALLQPLASGVVANALLSDELVMNVAFLIDEARQVEFDSRVRELDRLFDNEVSFRVIGPLPPYSFCTVEVARVSRKDVEEARGMLGLSEASSGPEIRKAYRTLAAEEGRTASPSGDRLARLRQASEVLRTALRTSGTRESECFFTVSVSGGAHREVEAARFGAAMGL